MRCQRSIRTVLLSLIVCIALTFFFVGNELTSPHFVPECAEESPQHVLPADQHPSASPPIYGPTDFSTILCGETL
jgi:hypothetical protein